MNQLSPVWGRLSQIVVERAEGCYMYDGDNNRYLDFTSGIGVTNTGHCHPQVVEAIQAQTSKLIFGQANVVVTSNFINLVDELKTVMPSHLDGFFFSNSGAEAVEAAVKLARQATGKPNIIVFQGSFHGRTAQTMAMTTSKTIYRAGYTPLPSGVFVAPYPYSYRYGWSEEETADFCLNELEYVLKGQTAPSETAAIVIEPVLGEGGYVVPSAKFMQGLRKLCDKHGMLLIMDEIQSGFGRTGKFFAHEHFDVRADIVIMAKGLASGMPMSAIAAPLDLMKKWPTGTHGGTYGGGNALAAAAAAATVRVIRDEGLVANAAARGQQLMDGLEELQGRYPFFGDVRGLGLMVGVEIGTSRRAPDAALTSKIQQGCMEQNMLLLSCGTYSNVVRWIPPLVVSEQQINDGLQIFDKAVQAAVTS
ncbi:MAG: aminotransferase class III-fold pyridoxal phosphate-dependent enzyme [Chloroflexota bacterium]